MAGSKEVREFRRQLEREGWAVVRRTGSDHILMRNAHGQTITLPFSPSDGRWLLNAKGDIGRLERQRRNA